MILRTFGTWEFSITAVRRFGEWSNFPKATTQSACSTYYIISSQARIRALLLFPKWRAIHTCNLNTLLSIYNFKVQRHSLRPGSSQIHRCGGIMLRERQAFIDGILFQHLVNTFWLSSPTLVLNFTWAPIIIIISNSECSGLLLFTRFSWCRSRFFIGVTEHFQQV